MSKYFNYFPQTFYTSDGVTVGSFTNIISRYSFEKSFKNNTAVSYEYDIQDGDTPEIIADKFYDDSERHWIVLMFNDITDPQFDWPMDYRTLISYIDEKYSASANVGQSGSNWAKSNTHAYYKVETRTTISTNTITVNKIEVDASFGTPLDAGSEYKIREDWKKMTEDFAATILGNASIHIPPDFNDTDVIQELNRCNIIYKYKGSVVDKSPYMFINNHIGQCQDENCSSKKTIPSGGIHYFRNYSAKEGIVLAKIVEFKMTHGLVPKLREEKNKTAQAKMQFMRKLAAEANAPVGQLWSSMPYKQFLDRFHEEHDLSVKGFGRYEIYQYYSEKMVLEKQLVDLIKSPSHDYRSEIELRTQIIELKNKHLKHFQEMYDMQTNVESSENSAFAQTLQKLEEIRELVSSGKDNMRNRILSPVNFAPSVFLTYSVIHLQKVSRIFWSNGNHGCVRHHALKSVC